MSTLNVGTGQLYTTISAAVAAAHDGDVVSVQAGTYTNDFPTITHQITLQSASAGMVNMVATVSPPNGKAILTVTPMSPSTISASRGRRSRRKRRRHPL